MGDRMNYCVSAKCIRVAMFEDESELMMHTDLASVFTHPNYQRKGIASAMLKWGIAQATREGKDIYVAATAAAAPLYRKHRFIPKGGFVMSNSDCVYLSMVKKAEHGSI